VGFEPTVGCPTLDFESSALNRTQPPFPIGRYCRSYFKMRNCRRGSEFAKAKHRAIWRSWVAAGERISATSRPLAEASKPELPGFPSKPKISEKCYNFRLAQVIFFTAYCVSARTVTLLLVVDWNSQVVSAAVHDYSHPIRNLNPPSPP
jgi:hypothetical protein